MGMRSSAVINLDKTGLLLLVGLSLLVVALPVEAGLVPCQGLKCEFDDFLRLFVNIFKLLMGLAAIVAALVIVWAGARLASWGFLEQPESELAQAKDTFKRALFGFAVVALAYLLVNTLVIVLGGGGINALLDASGL